MYITDQVSSREIISLTYLSLAVLFHYLISPDVITEIGEDREDIYVMCMVVKNREKKQKLSACIRFPIN